MSTAAQPASTISPDAPPRQHYDRAPIVEAIIDVRLSAAPTFRITNPEMKTVLEAEKAQYSQVLEAHTVEATANFGPAGMVTTSARAQHDADAYRLQDNNGKQAAHLEGGRFSFSKYEPYETWETLRDEAKRIWHRYVQVVRPVSVHRLSLRYVNRIDIPLVAGDLKEWLLTVPDVHPSLGPGVTSYMMELQIPQVGLPKTVAMMRQALVQPHKPEVISIVLDIDVVRGVDLSGSDADLAQVWQMFETLHTRENQIFENTITERVRERIR